jgi:exopolysaccharide biosynthesis polyprenyl glycosylphosphotransferase
VRRRTLSYQATLLFLVLADLLCVLGAYAGAFSLRIYFPLPFTVDLLPSARLGEVNHPFAFLLATQVLLLYFFGFYDLQTLKRRVRLVTNVAAALGVQLLATTAWYFFRGDLFFPRSVLVLFWLLNTLGVAGLRLWMVRRLGRVQPTRVLLVGTVEDVRAFLAGLPDLLHLPELTVAGLVSLNGDRDLPQRFATEKGEDEGSLSLSDLSVSSSDSSVSAGPVEGNIPWLGSADDLPNIVQEIAVDDVILLSSATWKDSFVDRLLRLSVGQQGQACPGRRGERPRVLVVPSVYDILVGRVSSLRLHDVPLVEVLKDPREDMAFFVKEVLDVGIAGLLLAVSLPILILAAVAVKLTSPGPVLYRQRRVGKAGKEFTVYKLRTMVDDAEEKTGPVLASCGDKRITWVGRFLRASRIDEIPQLFNVLNGTMSLVGPRPERPEFAKEFLCKVPGYAERLQVKPGLTGLAQVNGEYHTTPEYKLKYDLAYIYNHSLWLDLGILAETVKVMLTRRGV